jgi:hypothetical protein
MFTSVIGHDRIKEQLSRDLVSQNLHQSYLFAGPEHVGKMSLLRDFMSQLRTGQSFSPDSPFASQVLAGQGPGLLCFLDDGASLKVEQVRGIVDFVSKRTADDEWSFCVIEHVERMSLSAANAFLKVLEEPSPRMMYLMTTRKEHKLLATILSRVQTYRFGVVPDELVESYLSNRVHNELTSQELMKLAVGRIGLAIAMLDDEELFDRLRELYDYAMILFEDDLVDRFTLADHLTKKEVTKMELQQFLIYLALKLKQEGTQRYLSQLDRVQELSQLFDDTQVNKRLQLESLFADI